jgi:hypothetical protein
LLARNSFNNACARMLRFIIVDPEAVTNKQRLLAKPPDQACNMAAKTSRADFEAVFPQLVEDVSQAALKYNIPPDALKWFQKVCSIFMEL